MPRAVRHSLLTLMLLALAGAAPAAPLRNC